MEGRVGPRGGGGAGGKREKGKAIPGCPASSVSHMGRTVTGNSLLQQLQGETIKLKKCEAEIHSVIIPPPSPAVSLAKYRKLRTVASFLRGSREDIRQSPYKQDSIGIKSSEAQQGSPPPRNPHHHHHHHRIPKHFGITRDTPKSS